MALIGRRQIASCLDTWIPGYLDTSLMMLIGRMQIASWTWILPVGPNLTKFMSLNKKRLYKSPFPSPTDLSSSSSSSSSYLRIEGRPTPCSHIIFYYVLYKPIDILIILIIISISMYKPYFLMEHLVTLGNILAIGSVRPTGSSSIRSITSKP